MWGGRWIDLSRFAESCKLAVVTKLRKALVQMMVALPQFSWRQNATALTIAEQATNVRLGGRQLVMPPSPQQANEARRMAAKVAKN